MPDKQRAERQLGVGRQAGKKSVERESASETSLINFRQPNWFTILLFILALMFIYLQAILWIGEGSLAEVWRLKKSITQLQHENSSLQERNQKLIDEVEGLRTGLDLIEYRAREDLGLVKENEIFYHVIDHNKNK